MTVLVLLALAVGYVTGRAHNQVILAKLRWILDLQAQRLDAALRPRTPTKRHIPGSTR